MNIKTLRIVREITTWTGIIVTVIGIIYSIIAKGINPGTYISLAGVIMSSIGHFLRITISRIEVSDKEEERAEYEEYIGQLESSVDESKKRIEELEIYVDDAKRYVDSPFLKEFIEGKELDEYNMYHD